ncbi:hypothetical protein AYR66_07755 [Noviherbaspirillum denitrificans]|uniref:Diguanylate cyclase n=1 Tax=Noviherbaspirillum denitrificans TaxID=1968433 RepID=A0A254T9U2_9BURK|nr:hypothetical protein AYR66_07755 [Noviherbaspirillum denitrificans]
MTGGDLRSFYIQAQKALYETQLGSAVVLADKSGQQILNTSVAFGQPLPLHGNPDIVQRVFETGEPAVSDIFIGSVLHMPIMVVGVPVLRDGKVQAFLNVNIYPDSFNDILSAQRLPYGWVATIFDSKGTIVTRSRESQRFSGQKPSRDYFDKLMSSGEGTFDAVMKDGESARAAYTSSPVTGWRIAIAIPHAMLAAQFKQRISMLALGIAVLFAIGIAMAGKIGGRIVRAFHALVAPARALGAGEPVHPPAVEIVEAAAVAKAMDDAATLLTERDTALRDALQTLRESQYRSALALKAGGTAVWELDVASRRLLPADDLLFAMLGYPPQELQTMDDWMQLVHKEDRAGMPKLIGDVIEGRRENYWQEMRLRASDGSWRWIMSQAIAAERGPDGRAVRLIGTHTDVTERKLAQEHARQAALHDPLTGLPNRALVFEYGSHLLAAARRNHARGALLFIDLDRFKPINDIYGHETGDRVLQEVARRLSAGTRQEDLVGRLGGDEFVVVLPVLDADRRRAATVAQHLVDSISQPYLIDTLELSLSPSIGISFYPEHASDISALLHAADLAMYQVKQTGRASYQFYTPELDRHADEAHSLEARVRQALQQGGLRLHYQPVVDIRSGRITGAEALVRLCDREGDMVGPDRFIPVAESAGLITELGEWVVAEACRQRGVWREEGLTLSIAVNVSPLQFRQRDFAERLSGILADNGADPCGLEVEVTESAVMDNLDEAIKVLDRIKALGVKVALDDFGTGYSSLSRLTSLPLDKLKVDQSFVRRIESDQASRTVTGAIIALGHSLKLDVIGEGIESEDALRYLQEHGCSLAQGFWFSRPLPADEFAQWCRARQEMHSAPVQVS